MEARTAIAARDQGRRPGQYLEPSGGCQRQTESFRDGSLRGRISACLQAGLTHCLDFALPRRCLLCGDPAESSNLCRPCLRDLPWNEGACGLCGLPWQGQVGGVCPGCLAKPPAWDALRAALRYEFPANALVRQLKFQGQVAAAPALAAAMLCYTRKVQGSGLQAGASATLLSGAKPAYCLPVPLHGWRRFRRGYNQAQELARLVAQATRCELSLRLIRTRHTAAQTRLSAGARNANLRGAFAWRGPRLAGAQVVLVDDVFTTGATARECVEVLRRAGAGQIEVWVAARVYSPRS